ncbi:hypothetical protein ACVRXB_10390, partial [Streptococcus pantholopis]
EFSELLASQGTILASLSELIGVSYTDADASAFYSDASFADGVQTIAQGITSAATPVALLKGVAKSLNTISQNSGSWWESFSDIWKNYSLQTAKSSSKNSPIALNINLSSFWDDLFGSQDSVSVSQNYRKEGNWLFTTYHKQTEKSVTTDPGVVQTKTDNGRFSGVAINAGPLSFDVSLEDWHFNLNTEINLFGYTGGVKADLGFSNETGIELDVAGGGGRKTDTSSSTDYFGLKVSTDLNDGILGGYHQHTTSTTSGNTTTSTQNESGFQVGNWGEVAAVAVVAGIIVAPEVTVPVLGTALAF